MHLDREQNAGKVMVCSEFEAWTLEAGALLYHTELCDTAYVI